MVGEAGSGKTQLVNLLTGGLVNGMRMTSSTVIDWYNALLPRRGTV